MAREGLFDDADCALSWHPDFVNSASACSFLANFNIYFRFKGRSAHAAAAPHLGRSALDAVELMNVGVNYLREHVIQEARNALCSDQCWREVSKCGAGRG